ncbi:Replicative DNA helicase [Andreprevotia sp. IGB-42]|uniref:replicative DNA helicase n=1 Tax=Andreprevotia sp. IGB-42 TaxID=2497473 RepID=UPI001357C403|nr:replicative DNA helicase [Andreprevotia sp. IGB-42]KAF0811371.1 Replicative DNA helicase [Andreprevotia sp. IGB-42]
MNPRLQAEAAYLGCVLRDATLLDAHAVPQARFSDAHRAVYSALLRLVAAGITPSLIDVYETLAAENTTVPLAEMGDLYRNPGAAANIALYAQRVIDHGKRAQLADIGHAIAHAAAALACPEAAHEHAIGLLAELDAGSAQDWVQVKSLLHGGVAEIDRRYRADGAIPGVPVGLADFDELTGGLQAGDLVIVAGRPAMGKTAFAMHCAQAVAANRMVALFCLEMGEQQTAMRTLATQSGINMKALQRGRLDDADWAQLANGVERAADLQMVFDFHSNPSLARIAGKCRKLKRQHGLGLVVVDYLQLMSDDGSENRTQEISRISRGLKAIAKDLQVPVIALSQLSRKVEERGDKRPLMSDLRESGAIEQDADLIVFMYRPGYYDRAQSQHYAMAIVGKSRQGETGDVPLFCDMSTQRFANWAADLPTTTPPNRARNHFSWQDQEA